MWSRSHPHQQCWFYASFSFKTFLEWLCFLYDSKHRSVKNLKLPEQHLFKLLVVYHSNYGCTSFESNFTLNCIPLKPCRKRLCGSKCNFRKILVEDFPKFSRGFPSLLFQREIKRELCKIIHRFGAWFNSVCN